MTPSEFKQQYLTHNLNGHFFSRDTMKFFGDTMKSYGCRKFDGKYVLYRKPNAMVDVFGTWKMVSSDPDNLFEAWYLDDNGKIQRLSKEDKDILYRFV